MAPCIFMKYIYGPVSSRRLGLSLGLSLTAHKTCNLDCLYCQLGRTTNKATERKDYLNIEEVLAELKSWLDYHPEEAKGLQYITLSGAGEPTLNIKIGEAIERIKRLTSCPVAVITNAVLLNDPGLRREILGANLIVPSLDAADQAAFDKINRPVVKIEVGEIIDGLVALRKEFRGKIWLEVMLIRGVNDSSAQIEKLREAIERINPDKIQLNSPVRTTAEDNIVPLEKSKLEKIKDAIGHECEIV